MLSEVSEEYIQKVNTERLVLDLRAATGRAFSDGMQVATAIGALQMMAREIEDDAIMELRKEV